MPVVGNRLATGRIAPYVLDVAVISPTDEAVVATVATMLLTPNICIPGYVEVHSLHAIGVLDICVHDFLCLVHTRSVVPFGWNCVFI